MLVVDLDGTLVNKEGVIAEEDKNAIKRLRDSRVMVVLATGRVINACTDIVKDLGLNNPHIFFDGALTYVIGVHRVIDSWPLDDQMVKEMVDFTHKNNIYLELYSHHDFFVERKNWSDDIHRHFFHVEPEIGSFDGIWDRKEILKGEILIHNEQEAEQSRLFQEHFGSRLRYSIATSPAFPDVEFVNILNPVASKGMALRNLAKFVGTYPSEIVVIGDGHNDVSMMQEVDVSVAVQNAFPEVIQAAEYVTLDVEHHGVSEAIKFFFPD